MPRANLEIALGMPKKEAYSRSMAERARIIGAMLAKDDTLQSNSPALWVRSYLSNLSELGGDKT